MVLKVAGPKSSERPRVRSFTIDEYERMVEAGILCGDEHVELLEGVIVEMAPMGAGDTSDVHTWHELIDAGLPPWATIRVQSAIRLPPDFEPEPDLAVVHRRPHRYRSRHPGPDDILLLVEVADRDRCYPRLAVAQPPVGRPEQ